jgi:hypothetical protein
MIKEKIEDYVLFSALSGSVTLGEDTWLIDSGAFKHMTGQRDILSSLTENNFPQKVTVEDDYQYPIKGVGESYQYPITSTCAQPQGHPTQQISISLCLTGESSRVSHHLNSLHRGEQ